MKISNFLLNLLFFFVFLGTTEGISCKNIGGLAGCGAWCHAQNNIMPYCDANDICRCGACNVPRSQGSKN